MKLLEPNSYKRSYSLKILSFRSNINNIDLD